MVLLSLSAVRKAFGTHEVIRDATLALPGGRRLGLVGVNGSGQNHAAEDHQRRYAIRRRGNFHCQGRADRLSTQHADIDGELSIMEELTRVFDPLIAMEKRLARAGGRNGRGPRGRGGLCPPEQRIRQLTRRLRIAGG